MSTIRKIEPAADRLLSIILLSYYSKERIVKCYNNLAEVLNAENIPFELIIMDDGSKDNSYEIACCLEKRVNNVRAYKLSRNYTSHYSIFAGLSLSNGACAIPIPDDEQQPYATITQMYRLWEKGHKVIIPHRSQRDDPNVSKFFSRTFYKIINNLSDIRFPEGGADTFFIDREVINVINQYIHPIRTSSITEVLRLGYDPYFLPYSRPLGDNKKSRWSFKKKWNLAKDFFFSCSSFPIKFITFCGISFSIVSFLLIIAFATIKILSLEKSFTFFNVNVQGWTSTIIAISFFSGLILFSLGMIAEYIWRIYEEVKGRPGYIVRKKE